MPAIRSVFAPLVSATTYTRWVYLILGGAVGLPYLLASLVLATMGATAGPDYTDLGAGGFLAATAPAVPLIAATAWIPGARTLEGHITRTLLRGPIADEPIAEPASGRSRLRTGAWLVLHFVVGFAACLATMVALTESALLALAGVTGRSSSVLALTGSPILGAGPLSPLQRLLAPVIGVLVLLALVALMGLTGAALARAAPRLLGPSAAERLAAAQDRAAALAERNRLARELHDSIGHALSVVALQAGTAARLLDSDPAFARRALEAIADQARTATDELDHVLGLLREERRPGTAPQRSLTDLPGLIDATRAIGADLDARVDGDPASVPGVVSRETYRICQEGLTNALRHGGRVPITLTLAIGGDRLTVEITNPSAAAPRRASGGRGLRGMRERLRLLGGTLDAGTEGGTWRLRAAIRWGGHR
ncbi:sensor histidine kinase [Nocardiopsis mangrovi]|uniref:histidine kinase n=1 Tax=Nocardiopsis mangrovi TaxID=1179818 RepID=A0ABV9DTQ8_9ACTN